MLRPLPPVIVTAAYPGALLRPLPHNLAFDDFNESKIKRGQPGNAGQFASNGPKLSPAQKAAATKAKLKAQAAQQSAPSPAVLKAMSPGQKAAATKAANKAAAAAKGGNMPAPKATHQSTPEKIVDEMVDAYGFKKGDTIGAETGSVQIYKKSNAAIAIVMTGPNAGAWASVASVGVPKTGDDIGGLMDLLDGKVPPGATNHHNASIDTLAEKIGGGKKMSAEQKAAAAKAEADAKEAHAKAKAAEKAAHEAKHALYHSLKKARPTPTTSQKSAIGSYKGSGYKQINHELRFEHKPGYNATLITEWLETASLPHEAVLYRGVKAEAAKHLKSVMFPGAKIIDRGFMSMSTDKSFSNSWAGGSGNLLMEITVPKGAKAAAIVEGEHSDSEYEILGQRDSVLEITSFDFKTGVVKAALSQPGIITHG